MSSPSVGPLEPRTSGGRFCSRCSAAPTRPGRSPRHGRITCARSAAPGTPARNTSRLIAMIEGDRQRACRHHAGLIDAAPPGSDGVAASYRLILARDLCYLGRLEKAEPLLRQAQAVPAGPVEQALAPCRRGAPPRRTRRAEGGGGSRARRRRRRGDRDRQSMAPGLGLRGPRHRARARRPDRRGARGARARARAL